MSINIAPDTPKAERVGNILFCDKLPYPTDYKKNKLSAVVFVPRDPTYIQYARDAIGHLIAHGRLSEDQVKLRTVEDPMDEYDFEKMVQGVLTDIAKAEMNSQPKIITDIRA